MTKVLFAGNLCNVGYFMVKNLRSRGIDADLLMEKYPHIASDPKMFDTNLATEGYPPWIRFWDNRDKNWKFHIVKIMRGYDLIHGIVELPIAAMLSMRPFIAHSLGSDLRELAFERSVKGVLLRKAYRRAKILIFSSPDLHALASKLNIKNTAFMPLPWDSSKFEPRQVGRGEMQDKFVIFHPSSQYWGLKENDRFLKAFVRLCKERENVHLILVDRGVDVQRAREMLDVEHVKGKVTFLGGTLGQQELVYYYNLADAVADQFHWGVVGLISLESLSCAKPVIAYIDEDTYGKFYDELPPLMNARSEEEIYKAMLTLIDSRNLGPELGKRGREWVLQHHGVDKIISKFVKMYDAITNGDNITAAIQGTT